MQVYNSRHNSRLGRSFIVPDNAVETHRCAHLCKVTGGPKDKLVPKSKFWCQIYQQIQGPATLSILWSGLVKTWAIASILFFNGLLCTAFQRHQHRCRQDTRTPTHTPTQPTAPTETSTPTPTCQHPHPRPPSPPTPTPTPTQTHANSHTQIQRTNSHTNSRGNSHANSHAHTNSHDHPLPTPFASCSPTRPPAASRLPRPHSLAGRSDIGARDVPATSASFKLPLAVALSADGSVLFVGNLGMVRTILFVDSPHSLTGVRGDIVYTCRRQGAWVR